MSRYRRRSREKKKEDGKNYIRASITGAILILIVKLWWPEVIPFRTFEFWTPHGKFIHWLLIGAIPIAWGVGVNIFRWTALKAELPSGDPRKILIGGSIISAFAGITEEIAFRWLIFLSAIVTVKIGNWFFFGWLGFGIAKWFHLACWGPIANWTTFKLLEPWIFHETGWAVGAAILYSNAFFRDGHKYQGFFGYVNSWFMGMAFFWILFHYGLLACIMIHFLYDFMIYAAAAVAAVIGSWLATRRRKPRRNKYAYIEDD